MRLAQTVRLVVLVFFGLILIPVGILVFYGITGDSLPEEDLLTGTVFSFSIVAALLMPALLGFRWLRDRSIRKNGIPARATILRVEGSGMRINNRPVVEIDLQVHPPYEGSFETTAEYCLRSSEGPALVPGARIRVHYLPGSKDVVIADTTETGQDGGF